MVDQLYPTRRAGELLGGLHPNDVLVLIRERRLRAVRQRVRGEGKRPRYYVPASAITEYIKGLPAAVEETSDEPAKPKRGSLPRDLEAELKCIKRYHGGDRYC